MTVSFAMRDSVKRRRSPSSKNPLHEAVGLVLSFVPAEQRGVPIQEKIEFGVESAKFLRVYD